MARHIVRWSLEMSEVPPLVDIGNHPDREKIEAALLAIGSEVVVPYPGLGVDCREITRAELRALLGLLNGLLTRELPASWVAARAVVTSATTMLEAADVDSFHFLDRANLVLKFLRRYRLMVDRVVSEDILSGSSGPDVSYLLSLFTEGGPQELGISLRQYSLLQAMHSLGERSQGHGGEGWIAGELLQRERAFFLTVRERPVLPCLFLHGLPSVDEAFRGIHY